MSIMDFKWNSGRTNISEAKKIRVYIYICTIIITHAWIEFNSKFAQFTVIDSHFCNLSIFTQQGTDLRKRSTSWGFWASGSTNPFWTKRPRSNSKPNTQPNQKNKKKYTHKTQKRLGQNPRFWHEMQQFPQLSHNTVCVFEVVRWCCIIQLWGRGGTEDAWKTESLSHTCKQTDSANKWEWVRVSESEKKKKILSLRVMKCRSRRPTRDGFLGAHSRWMDSRLQSIKVFFSLGRTNELDFSWIGRRRTY